MFVNFLVGHTPDEIFWGEDVWVEEKLYPFRQTDELLKSKLVTES